MYFPSKFFASGKDLEIAFPINDSCTTISLIQQVGHKDTPSTIRQTNKAPRKNPNKPPKKGQEASFIGVLNIEMKKELINSIHNAVNDAIIRKAIAEVASVGRNIV
jgi:hypothetical protein